MRITPARLVTPALAFAVVSAGGLAAARPFLVTPAPAGVTVTLTAHVSRETPAMILAARRHPPLQPGSWHPRPPRPKVTVTYTPPPVQQPAQDPSADAVSAGIYSYSALETLWEQAGGSASLAADAACIAEHESSGNPAADNGAGDIGLWQIAQDHDPAANYTVPSVNAAEAVTLEEAEGWAPWTTAPDCGL